MAEAIVIYAEPDLLSTIMSQWNEIESSLAPAGVCLGGTVFSWCDEWWKHSGGDVSVHDTAADWTNYAYSDPNMNEEWWGITSISPETYQKTARQAYNTLKSLWT